jgi:carbamoyltransferase
LGISALYHDSAAALIEDGLVIAAAQEERFTRIKHDASFPANAIAYCLNQSHASWRDVARVCFYEKPFLKFKRLLSTYASFAPQGFSSFSLAMPLWLRKKLFQKEQIVRYLAKSCPEVDWSSRLLFPEHHLSHAASAFFPSPFREAAVLTVDGVGEFTTTSVALGKDNELSVRREIHFPHSLGLLYSAFTAFAGFKVNSGEYKLMGLAPYGRPRFASLIWENLIDVKQDGSFRLNMDFFDYCTGAGLTNERFHTLFGRTPRKFDEEITQFHMDLAASIQEVLDETMLRLTRGIASETGAENLCLAGGVALNCVTNGTILRDGRFKRLWVQPAAGDAGGALGAALAGYHIYLKKPRVRNAGSQDFMRGALLGPEYSQKEIEARLKDIGASFKVLTDAALLEESVEALVQGNALGWFQGRMEFGPRALGNRSILADPRSPSIQSTLNLKVKFRESFRPFAPSVLREDQSRYFDLETESPYMLIVAKVAERLRLPVTEADEKLFGIAKLSVQRSEIPGVTHVDYSARIQTVCAEVNPRFHSLLMHFKRRTGCSVLVNTSFNVRGEPIICTPEEAFSCFMATGIDSLSIGNCFLRKEHQPPALKQASRDRFQPD